MSIGINAGGSNVTIEGVYFQDVDTAIAVNSNNVQIANCYFQAHSTACISGGITRGRLTGNRFQGLITLTGCDKLTLVGNQLEDAAVVISDSEWIAIAGNLWDGGTGPQNGIIDLDTVIEALIDGNFIQADSYDGIFADTCIGLRIGSNLILNCDDGAVLDACETSMVEGNHIGGDFDEFGWIDKHGVVLIDSSDCMVADNLITEPGQGTDDTFDGVHVSGDSNRNTIKGNKVRPSQQTPDTRHGVNIADATCDDNVVVGNDLRPDADYGSGALNDSGTGTVLAYTGGAAGDNVI